MAVPVQQFVDHTISVTPYDIGTAITGYIIRYIRYLYAHSLLKADFPWEKDENWKTKTYDVLRKASGIIPGPSSSWDDLSLAYLDFCHHEKDLSLKASATSKGTFTYFPVGSGSQ